MNTPYRPNMAGFSQRLGLKNGIEDLVKRPVPQQEILYYDSNDMIDGKAQLQYNRQQNFNPRRRRWRRR